MPVLHVTLANCPIHGESPSEYGQTRKGAWSRNHTELRLSRYRIDLYQMPRVVTRPVAQIRDRRIDTTTLLFHEVPPERLEAAKRAAHDLAWLLGLCCMSEVHVSRFEYQGHIEYTSGFGATRFFRPIIDPRNGVAIRSFLEGTWPRFRKLKRQRRLREVIHYILVADRPEQPIEVKLVLSFVVLENLKATFAKSQGIPYVGGAFRKPASGRSLARAPRYSFRELLEMMQGSVGMMRPVRRIVKVRNTMVHFGLSSKPVDRRSFYYEECISQITEYVLRLLGYRGTYMDYRTMRPTII